jgi:hypothetical protein
MVAGYRGRCSLPVTITQHSRNEQAVAARTSSAVILFPPSAGETCSLSVIEVPDGTSPKRRPTEPEPGRSLSQMRSAPRAMVTQAIVEHGPDGQVGSELNHATLDRRPGPASDLSGLVRQSCASDRPCRAHLNGLERTN